MISMHFMLFSVIVIINQFYEAGLGKHVDVYYNNDDYVMYERVTWAALKKLYRL